MHADMLYHRLRAQEAEVAAAKAEGREPPEINMAVPKATYRTDYDPSTNPQFREELGARTKNLEGKAREAEADAVEAEWLSKAEMAGRVDKVFKDSAAMREQRRREGQEAWFEKLFDSLKGTPASPPKNPPKES